MERIDKIRFLRDLAAGRIVLADFKPRELTHVVEIDGPGQYLLGSREISRSRYEELLRKEPGYYTGAMDIKVEVVKN